MSDHEAILKRQRAKMEEHRAFLARQEAALGGGDAAAPPSAPPTDGAIATPAVSTARTTEERSATAASQAPRRAAASPSQAFSSPVPQQPQPHQHQHHHDPSPVRSRYGSMDGGMAPMAGQGAFSIPRSGGSPLNVYARSTQWAHRKQQRMEELQARKHDNHEVECPFTPQVHDVDSSTISAGRCQAVSGFDDFMKRQEYARTLRESKVLKTKCDGSKWTNTLTVPEEFQLGQRNRRPIRALRQPMKPPGTRTPVALHEMLLDPRPVANGASPLQHATVQGAVPPKGAFSAPTSVDIIDVGATSKKQTSVLL